MLGVVVRVQQIFDQHGAVFWLVAAAVVALLVCAVIWLEKIASVKQGGKTRKAKRITYFAVLVWLLCFVSVFLISPTLYFIITGVILSYHFCIGWTATGTKRYINLMDGGLYAAIISLVLLVLFIAQTTT